MSYIIEYWVYIYNDLTEYWQLEVRAFSKSQANKYIKEYCSDKKTKIIKNKFKV